MFTLAGMKGWALRHRFIVVFVIASTVTLLFIEAAPAFRGCVRANQAEHDPQTVFEEFSRFLWVQYWCAGVFLHETGDIITAIATVTMAAFTGTLWWSTASTAKLSEKTVDLAEKQFLMEGQQAGLAGKQHELARLQHIAANKPHLKIRSVVVERSLRDGSGCMFKKGLKPKGSLVVANTGATDAIIKESRYRFFWSYAGLPMEPPLEGENFKQLQGPEQDQVIEGFGSCIYEISCDEELSGDVQASKRGGGISLYVMGIIRYADITEKERMMGFCREYVPPDSADGEGSFRPVENPDYEYQD